MAGNRQVWLKSRPNGIPQAENFGIRDGDIPPIAEGEFLVQSHYLSSDPAARGWIADASVRLRSGRSLKSRNPRYSIGEKVMGLFGWQEYAAASDKHVNLKIAPRYLPLSLSLGVLGLNGFTAYFSTYWPRIEIGDTMPDRMLPRRTRDGQNVVQGRGHIGRDDLQRRLAKRLPARVRPAMVPSQLMSKSPGVPTSSRSVIVRSSRQIFQHTRKRRMSPAKRGRYSKYPSGGFYLRFAPGCASELFRCARAISLDA